MSMLHAKVSAGESGPVITLSGEADMTVVAELSDLVTGQIADGTRHLTISASELSFADLASVRVLLSAAGTLRQRGGGLVLLRPQYVLARVLEFLGADHMITVSGEIERAPELRPPSGEQRKPNSPVPTVRR